MAAELLHIMRSQTFVMHECINCGTRFAVPSAFDVERHKDKRSFYCPNGHSQAYIESEWDKIRRERDVLRQQTARLEDELNATRRELENTKKRVGAGVCPCCHRTFRALARHMKNKHPDMTTIRAA